MPAFCFRVCVVRRRTFWTSRSAPLNHEGKPMSGHRCDSLQSWEHAKGQCRQVRTYGVPRSSPSPGRRICVNLSELERDRVRRAPLRRGSPTRTASRRPRPFETSHALPLMRLFALDDVGWLKALRLANYAPRAMGHNRTWGRGRYDRDIDPCDRGQLVGASRVPLPSFSSSSTRLLVTCHPTTR
jgi:hypothetical protein